MIAASTLETALSRIGRNDIVQQCVFNVDQSELQLLNDESRDASIRRSIPYSDKDIMKVHIIICLIIFFQLTIKILNKSKLVLTQLTLIFNFILSMIITRYL